VFVSHVEIYNDQIFDLLSENLKQLQVGED